MSIFRARDLGSIGIVKDIAPHELPPQAWTQGGNVRCFDGAVAKFQGHSSVFGTPQIAPYWLMEVPNPSDLYWVYAGLQRVYATNGVTHYPLTRQEAGITLTTLTSVGTLATATKIAHGYSSGDWVAISGATPAEYNGYYQITVSSPDVFTYVFAGSGTSPATGTIVSSRDAVYTGGVGDKWNGGVLHGIGVLNNGKDVPQMWLPVGSGQRLQGLSGWPAGVTAKVIRPFRNYLVALDVMEAGTRYPHVLRWSHPADPGAVPVSWDYTDPTKDAGRVPVSETGDFLVDCLPLRDINVIYKERSAYGMQFVGGQYVFRFFKISQVAGMLATGCVREVPPGVHAVLTQDNFIVHDGQQVLTQLDSKMRKYFFGIIDTANYKNSFVTINYKKNEVWACIPQAGSVLPDFALVWNWKTGAFTFRDLPSVAAIEPGQINQTAVGTTWGTISGTWGGATRTWGTSGVGSAFDAGILMAQPLVSTGKLFIGDNTEQFDGVNFTSYISKTDIVLGDIRGEEIDTPSTKFVRTIHPYMDVSSGGSVTFYIGTQMVKGGTVTWSTGYVYDPLVSDKIDVTATGKLFAVKIESTGNVSWKLYGYDLEYVRAGKR